MPRRYTKSDASGRRGHHTDPQKQSAAHTRTDLGGDSQNYQAGAAHELSHAQTHDYQSQQPQQQMEEYPPYSSFTAFASEAAQDSADDAERIGPNNTSANARYLFSRPAPLQTNATAAAASSASFRSAQSGSGYTTVNTKRALQHPQHQQSSSSVHVLEPTTSPSHYGRRDSLSGVCDPPGASLSQLSPIMPSSYTLPSLSSASLPLARGYSAFSSPTATAVAAHAARTSLTGLTSVLRSRAAANTAGSPLGYTSALPSSVASSTTLAAQAARLQRMNDGFVREDTELEFNEDLARSLPSTAIASPSFVASSFSSPLYAMPQYASAASAGTSGQSSVRPQPDMLRRHAERATTALSPLVSTATSAAPASLSPAVYGPSEGVELQFPQFVDFASRTEAMHPFGLDQVLDVDIVEQAVPAAQGVVDPAYMDAPMSASHDPAEVAMFSAFQAAYAESEVGCAPVEPTMPMREPSMTAAQHALPTTTTALVMSASGSMVPPPRSRTSTGHGMNTSGEALTDATATSALAAGDATPERTKHDDNTDDPSPRPHLPPAGGSGGKYTAVRPAEYSHHHHHHHSSSAAATAFALATRPYASSTVAYMRDAGEPTDADAISPFDAAHLRAPQGRPFHHTPLFADEAPARATTTAATVASDDTRATRPQKSPALSPYSPPWTPATGSMLNTATNAAVASTPISFPKRDERIDAHKTLQQQNAFSKPAVPAPGTVSAASSASQPTTATKSKSACADATSTRGGDDYDRHADADGLAGLTLSQHRSSKKLQKQRSSQSKRGTTAALGVDDSEHAYSPDAASARETPMRRAPMTLVGTALQQALDEAQSEDDAVRVVMPRTNDRANDQLPSQSSQPVLGQALRALMQQVKAQPHQQPRHLSQPYESAQGVEDSAVLHVQTTKTTSKRGAEPLADHGSDAAIFTRPDGVLRYAVTVVGHMSITSEIFSTAPVEKGSYVLYEADRGEDIGCVLACQNVENNNASGTPDATSNPTGLRTLGSFQRHRVPPHVLRRAAPDEIEVWLYDQVEEARATLPLCRDAVERAHLPLNVVGAVYQYNRKKLTFYYDSQERVDFRQLLQTLFSQFRCRIWMEKMPVSATCMES